MDKVEKMLQLSNLDDKSEWNLSEAHIIIPMIDGDVNSKDSEKMLTSTLTLSSLEGEEQAILTNTFEHSFVIGLDKNVFESPNYKSDLVIIQNPELKLHSSNSDLKSPVAYTISYLDHDKCEVLWQSTVSKDRICESDRTIIEGRDILNHDDSVHELQKTEHQIHLNGVDTDLKSQLSKTNNEILIEKTDSDSKNEKKSQFINYFEDAQSTETIPILQHLDKSGENLGLGEKKLLECKSNPLSNAESTYKLEENPHGIIFHISESAVEFSESQSLNLVECNNTVEKVKIVSYKNEETKVKNTDIEKTNKGGSNSLPEKSLPLKKKAKMKRTLTLLSSENQKFLSKQDIGAANQQINTNTLTGRKIKQMLRNTNSLEEEKSCLRNSDEFVINKVLKQKKMTKFKTSSKKFKKSIPFCSQEGKNEFNKIYNDTFEEDVCANIEISGFDENKFNNTNDLVDCLRKCQMINANVWQTLSSGLKELKIDILKEMNAKRNVKYNENTSYSPQLMAFALVLYFKQPAAFNYLSQIYKNGWPSFNEIKKWKRRMNSCRRPNFIRMEDSKT